ncbi:MAG TPA: hypothetical protein VGR62_09860 [Candidatus Binatia bacterium]|jgi:hypothetical protein|nr:hypothetical protein [Candidatus Binatia bacterium]
MRRLPIALVTILALHGVARAEGEWLSLGAKGWSPTVTSKSGIGTAHATAEAKVTREELEGWCANWTPDDKGCVARELANPDTKKTYRASADCTRGTITPVDGSSYTLDGVWDGSDIGEGRTRWRDAAGQVVGRDNASGGLAISQQWEVLCPGPLKVTAKPGRTTPAPAKPAPAGEFAVGQIIEAKFGRDWVRGRVDKIRQGPSGPEYDVRLDNGQRGILPPRMVRKAP